MKLQPKRLKTKQINFYQPPRFSASERFTLLGAARRHHIGGQWSR